MTAQQLQAAARNKQAEQLSRNYRFRPPAPASRPPVRGGFWQLLAHNMLAVNQRALGGAGTARMPSFLALVGLALCGRHLNNHKPYSGHNGVDGGVRNDLGNPECFIGCKKNGRSSHFVGGTEAIDRMRFDQAW
jgi:hypothetical protein